MGIFKPVEHGLLVTI